jgi:hypothetical protein
MASLISQKENVESKDQRGDKTFARYLVCVSSNVHFNGTLPGPRYFGKANFERTSALLVGPNRPR